jgi:hypothetical protein
LVDKSDKSANTSSNTCCNSLASTDKLWGIERRVYHVIDASEVELKPCEIARIIHSSKKPEQITSGQYTTVRVACRKLLDKGLIVQPYDGSYCNKITHGVRFVPLCVHNVTLLAKVCQNLKHWESDEFVGGVKIHVCFGKERKQVSGYIACDVGGMSHDACLLALNRWFEIVEGRLGYCLQDLVLQTVEFNKDYHGCRIDGMQCVTKQDLYGVIDRTYQKEEDVIRRERKICKPMTMNKFEAEIHRQLDDIGTGQGLFELKEEVRQLKEAMKFSNSRQLELERLLEATYNVIRKSSGGLAVENLETMVKEFASAARAMSAEVKELKEVMGKLGESADPKTLDEKQSKLREYLR